MRNAYWNYFDNRAKELGVDGAAFKGVFSGTEKTAAAQSPVTEEDAYWHGLILKVAQLQFPSNNYFQNVLGRFSSNTLGAQTPKASPAAQPIPAPQTPGVGNAPTIGGTTLPTPPAVGPSPAIPAPQTSAAQTPAPQTPAPQTPAPQTPAPQIPAPQTPAPQTPAPAIPAPETPAPAPTSRATSGPAIPAPETPAPAPAPAKLPAGMTAEQLANIKAFARRQGGYRGAGAGRGALRGAAAGFRGPAAGFGALVGPPVGGLAGLPLAQAAGAGSGAPAPANIPAGMTAEQVAKIQAFARRQGGFTPEQKQRLRSWYNSLPGAQAARPAPTPAPAPRVAQPAQAAGGLPRGADGIPVLPRRQPGAGNNIRSQYRDMQNRMNQAMQEQIAYRKTPTYKRLTQAGLDEEADFNRRQMAMARQLKNYREAVQRNVNPTMQYQWRGQGRRRS